MDADASAYAEKSTGIHVEVGSLPSDVPFDGKYDLICMFDVLEDVEDDAGALTRLASMLEPGGHLVISVPAYAWLWSDHDVVLHHFRRYSRSRLRSDLTTAGLLQFRAVSRRGRGSRDGQGIQATARWHARTSGPAQRGTGAALRRRGAHNPAREPAVRPFGIGRRITAIANLPFRRP
jgi:SAM-dependent methyltransferase